MSKENDRYDAFISYRRNNHPLSGFIKVLLENNNLKVFLDVDNLDNGDFNKKLINTIKQTSNFILVVTPDTFIGCENPRNWIRREIETAIDFERNIVIVVSELELNFSNLTLPRSIQSITKRNVLFYDNNNRDKFVEKMMGYLKLDRNNDMEIEIARVEQEQASEEYLNWLQDFIFSMNNLNLSKLNIDKLSCIGKRRYPIAFFRAANSESIYKDDLLKINNLQLRNINEVPDLFINENIPDWIDKDLVGELRSNYLKILFYTKRVRRWNMRGFALQSLYLDNDDQVIGIDSILSTYGENILSSHFLGHLIYLFYKKDLDIEIINKLYPMVIVEHSFDNIKKLSLSTNGSLFPLLSVQACVVFKDQLEDDEWYIITMKRETGVATASGYWQIPPAGGFEIYGTENDDDDHVKSQYDIRLAIIREFLEEIYGDIDMACELPENSSQGHQGSPGYRAVMKALKKGEFNIHFLGVILDLVSFRPEFSFLIIVEESDLFDLKYQVTDINGKTREARWMSGSHEGKRLLKSPISDYKNWFNDKLWTSGSAGLFKMLSDLTKDDNSWLRKKYKNFPVIDLE